MASDDNVTADAFSRALASMFDLSRAGVDWTTVYRAVLAHREEQRERWLDLHDDLSGRQAQAKPADLFRHEHAGSDAAALAILLEAALLRSMVRTGRAWQALLRQATPPLKRAADLYQSQPDPSPQLRDALIEQVRVFVQTMGEFARDQGAQLNEDLGVMLDEILAPSEPGTLERSIRPARSRSEDPEDR